MFLGKQQLPSRAALISSLSMRPVCTSIACLWLSSALALGQTASPKQERFERNTPGYVPEGQPELRASIESEERGQAVCAEHSNCKAFAFRTTKPTCYFYSRVNMGGIRMPPNSDFQVYSSGLAVIFQPRHLQSRGGSSGSVCSLEGPPHRDRKQRRYTGWGYNS